LQLFVQSSRVNRRKRIGWDNSGITTGWLFVGKTTFVV
jgi:hypothetical protein